MSVVIFRCASTTLRRIIIWMTKKVAMNNHRALTTQELNSFPIAQVRAESREAFSGCATSATSAILPRH